MKRIAREVKQIAISEASCTEGYSRHAIAVCSDDSMWELDLTEIDGIWAQLPNIPSRSK